MTPVHYIHAPSITAAPAGLDRSPRSCISSLCLPEMLTRLRLQGPYVLIMVNTGKGSAARRLPAGWIISAHRYWALILGSSV